MATPVRSIGVWLTSRDDGRVRVRMTPTDTVDRLCAMAQAHLVDYPPGGQIVRFAGRILRNGTLIDSGITNDSVVEIARKPTRRLRTKTRL